MELIMKTDMIKEFPAAILYNHEELKAELSRQIEKYKNIVVTEETIKSSKADKANLNHLKTALENKRKEVKKQCLQPYEAFERNIKELTALIDEPITAIDSQLKEFEKIKKEQKQKEIETIYEENIGIFKELVPLEKIWNGKWLNVTYKLSDIETEIKEIYSNLKSGLQIIEGFETEFQQEIKNKFFETLDIQRALQENERLKDLKEKQKKLQEQKDRQIQKYLQEQRNVKEEVIEQVSDLLAEESKEVQQEIKAIPEAVKEVQQEPIQILEFRVWVTQKQKMLLRDFLLENNIKFGRVE